ncbi:hypothetical protein ACTXT7_008524 [Hymenolepis weldensis]
MQNANECQNLALENHYPVQISPIPPIEEVTPCRLQLQQKDPKATSLLISLMSKQYPQMWKGSKSRFHVIAIGLLSDILPPRKLKLNN